jgi:hypothetical protein
VIQQYPSLDNFWLLGKNISPVMTHDPILHPDGYLHSYYFCSLPYIDVQLALKAPYSCL